MRKSYIAFPLLFRNRKAFVLHTNIIVLFVCICLWLLCTLPACSPGSGNEFTDKPGNKPDIPAYPYTSFSKIQLSENSRKETGVPTVTTTFTYLYAEGRLLSSSTLQQFTSVEPVEIESRTTVVYGDHQVVIEKESGTKTFYTLNDKGYAESCELREADVLRKYTFAYHISSDGTYYLNRLTEILRGEVTAEIRIEYDDSCIVSICQSIPVNGHEQEYVVSTAPEILNKGGIPSLFLSQMYPLSFHVEALYGKMLGEPGGYLIRRIVPLNGDETITYTYKTDGRGRLSSCRECINSYGADYVRTVNYIIE